MSNNNLKTHYSAKELLELSLACLPNTVQGIIYQSKKQGWESKKELLVAEEVNLHFLHYQKKFKTRLNSVLPNHFHLKSYLLKNKKTQSVIYLLLFGNRSIKPTTFKKAKPRKNISLLLQCKILLIQKHR